MNLCSRTDQTRAPNGIRTLYDFVPADQFDVHGTYVAERTTWGGLGAPVVAIGREMNKEARVNFSVPRTYYGVTAVARFEGRHCELAFEDPLAVETTRVDGQTYTLAADFTVPLAVMLASTDPKKFEPDPLRRASPASAGR